MEVRIGPLAVRVRLVGLEDLVMLTGVEQIEEGPLAFA